MPVTDLVPAYRPAISVRPRPAHALVEPAAPARRPGREGRTGDDGKAYGRRTLPPYRGRLFDFFV